MLDPHRDLPHAIQDSEHQSLLTTPPFSLPFTHPLPPTIRSLQQAAANKPQRPTLVT